jgi:hypothetical protein
MKVLILSSCYGANLDQSVKDMKISMEKLRARLDDLKAASLVRTENLAVNVADDVQKVSGQVELSIFQQRVMNEIAEARASSRSEAIMTLILQLAEDLSKYPASLKFAPHTDECQNCLWSVPREQDTAKHLLTEPPIRSSMLLTMTKISIQRR